MLRQPLQLVSTTKKSLIKPEHQPKTKGRKMEIAALIGGIYMALLSFLLTTKDFKSAVMMKGLPGLSGLAVILYTLNNMGAI